METMQLQPKIPATELSHIAGRLLDSWAWQLPALQSLTLYDCGVSGSLPESWTEWTGLTSLNLSSNSITGEQHAYRPGCCSIVS